MLAFYSMRYHMNFQKILIIQTAFIGDAILMTPLIEALHHYYPEAVIDIFINQQNLSLFSGHPKIRRVLTWDKQQQKYKKLRGLIGQVRKERYDVVINCHRFASSGMVAALSKAKVKIGFDKNPLSFFYTHRLPHKMETGVHEIDRNLSLLSPLMAGEVSEKFRKPTLYPSREDYYKVKTWQQKPYVCMAPTSVWFTKQFPASQWQMLIEQLPFDGNIFLLGGKDDAPVCEELAVQSKKKVINLAGKLNLLQSAALMQGAVLSFVNDSAPMHLASSVNAPVCAIYCSTVTDFGFYPLSDFAAVAEVQENLSCRPCGLHGHRACPEGHFRCAYDIRIEQLLDVWHKAQSLQ